MVPVSGSDSCAQHQCFNDYLQLLVFTGYEFTVNTDKCSTLCALIKNIAKGYQYPLTYASLKMPHRCVCILGVFNIALNKPVKCLKLGVCMGQWGYIGVL